VIVPAYNAARSLPTALASARDQSLRDIEILVVDDASRDRTHEIARSIASTDPRVRVIRRTTNGGPSAARNTGLQAAKGTWIAFLDADDEYLPERLAARAADCDLIADNIILRCPQSGRRLGLAINPAMAHSPRPLTPAEFVRNDRPFPGDFRQLGYVMCMIRRSFLEKHSIRYDPDIWCAEDFVFYMQCLFAGARIILLPDGYYQYTLSPESISRDEANLLRNYQHLALGNLRILTAARQRGDRAAVMQLRRRGRNIAFLRAFYGYRRAVQRRRWAEALAHLVQMPLAPVEFASLLRLYVARRISWGNELRQGLTGRPDRIEEQSPS
jgi:glycosyltransferase involved in cell wall biosynthesis